MFQYYLRAEGIALPWIGTGRLIFSHTGSDEEFGEVAERFVAAARAMQADGWWWQASGMTDKTIKKRILREMVAARLG
jgi:glutamate-1-semialdehyde 2,1-aminomutase